MGERAVITRATRGPLPRTDRPERGLAVPICPSRELTHAGSLARARVHCLPSPGRRDPRERSAAQGRAGGDEYPLAGEL
jgi:hypothetical protein